MKDLNTVQHPPALQAAKEATKALVRAAGGQDAAAAYCDKAQCTISRYVATNHRDFMPIDTVRSLEAVTHGTPNHPQVTRFLAREAGYVLVPLPRAVAADADWHVELGGVSKEVGDVVQRACEALADKSVSPGEARRIRIEIAEAQERLAMLDALAQQAEGF